MPTEVFQHLKKVYVRKQKLNISVDTGGPGPERADRPERYQRSGADRADRSERGTGPRPGAAPKKPRTREGS
jgi:ATP-dependent RNA helicase DeaD